MVKMTLANMTFTYKNLTVVVPFGCVIKGNKRGFAQFIDMFAIINTKALHTVRTSFSI